MLYQISVFLNGLLSAPVAFDNPLKTINEMCIVLTQQVA